MKSPLYQTPRRNLTLVATLGLTGLLTGCSLPSFLGGKPKDNRAFIQYWPPPEGSTELRLAVKDNIDMKGYVTSAGSEYLARQGKPATRDAACLAIARKRNVRIVGKANLSEFAVAPTGINQYFGTPWNPFSGWRKLIPGGSSSGSAAAVASGMADVAFGTDTAGSVRVPSAFCGVVGLKTTHGLVSLEGVHPIEAEHLDTVGPIGKNVEMTAQGMDLLEEGFASRYRSAVNAKSSGGSIRIGRLRLTGTDRRVDQAIDQALARAGFQVVELDDAFKEQWERAKKNGNDVAEAGAWISDKQFLRRPFIAARTKAAIRMGRLTYRTAYKRAVRERPEWQHTLANTFKKVDFIALPTTQTLPPAMPPDLKTGLVEGVMLQQQNTVAVNYAGNPAIAVPIPVRNAPVPVTSLQLIGPNRSEAGLLNAGRIVEATNPKS